MTCSYCPAHYKTMGRSDKWFRGVNRTVALVEPLYVRSGRSATLADMEANDTKVSLIRLQAERFSALELGADPASLYVTRLDDAIEDARTDHVTCAVMEIACLRRSLSGPTHG
jgi:hypothetical protein